ncbi:Uncharacterised protein [Mycobacteroides abscessus subsp. abscessus]|nr:Uncharacterised protein [Mycobacteroides abscessus subsp. abscessus]
MQGQLEHRRSRHGDSGDGVTTVAVESLVDDRGKLRGEEGGPLLHTELGVGALPIGEVARCTTHRHDHIHVLVRKKCSDVGLVEPTAPVVATRGAIEEIERRSRRTAASGNHFHRHRPTHRRRSHLYVDLGGRDDILRHDARTARFGDRHRSSDDATTERTSRGCDHDDARAPRSRAECPVTTCSRVGLRTC